MSTPHPDETPVYFALGIGLTIGGMLLVAGALRYIRVRDGLRARRARWVVLYIAGCALSFPLLWLFDHPHGSMWRLSLRAAAGGVMFLFAAGAAFEPKFGRFGRFVKNAMFLSR